MHHKLTTCYLRKNAKQIHQFMLTFFFSKENPIFIPKRAAFLQEADKFIKSPRGVPPYDHIVRLTNLVYIAFVPELYNLSPRCICTRQTVLGPTN